MNYFRRDHEVGNSQNAEAQIQLADDTCHIKTDPESGVLFDMEAVWCSFCQRPRFEDGVCTEICICVSFTTNTDTWMQQAVDGSSFENLSTRNCHYNAIDTWLHGSVDDDAIEIPQSSVFDAMIEISPVATTLGLYALSMPGTSSPATSVTGMTRGTSVTSGSDKSPSCGRSSLEMDSTSDSSEFRRMLNAKQRRREQNRESQHRFRERKNQVVKDLELKVENLAKINEILNREIAALRKKLGGNGEVV